MALRVNTSVITTTSDGPLVTGTLISSYDIMSRNTFELNSSSVTANVTSAPGGSSRNETIAKLEIAVLATILFFALFGNLVVIIVLMYRKRKLSRMQLFIIHLCIADISVGLFQVLPQLAMDITYRFDGNNFLCKVVKYMQVATMYSSTYVLIMTALDRYMSICNPLTSQTWTTRRVHVMVLIAWVLAGLFSLPQLIIFSYKQRGYDGVYDCVDNFDLENEFWTLQAYITWIFVSVYAIPLVILTICYTKICHVVWISVNAKENCNSTKRKSYFGKSKSNSTNGQGSYSPIGGIRNPRAHSKKMSKSKIKTIKLTLAVVLCFIICWAPFFITQMWSAFDVHAPYYTSHIMAIATLLASLNSCTNPWIYLAFSGRLCKRPRSAASAKTWMSSANTYMTEPGADTLRMRMLNAETENILRSRQN